MQYVYIAFKGEENASPIMAVFNSFDVADAYCRSEGYTLATWTVAIGFRTALTFDQ